MRAFFRPWPCLVVCLQLAACSPASAPGTVVSSVLEGILIDEGGTVSSHGLPQAVFETKPKADEWDIIRGRTSTSVHFNNCRSRPAEAEDDLKFTYDWTDDGTVDYFGTCRQTFRYTTPRAGLAEQARICVSDRRGQQVCKVWYIRLGRAAM